MWPSPVARLPARFLGPAEAGAARAETLEDALEAPNEG